MLHDRYNLVHSIHHVHVTTCAIVFHKQASVVSCSIHPAFRHHAFCPHKTPSDSASHLERHTPLSQPGCDLGHRIASRGSSRRPVRQHPKRPRNLQREMVLLLLKTQHLPTPRRRRLHTTRKRLVLMLKRGSWAGVDHVVHVPARHSQHGYN